MAFMERLKFWNRTPQSPAYDTVMEDEQLMSKESDELNAQYRLLQENQRRLKRWVSVLSVLLTLAILALLVTMGNGSWKHKSRGKTLSLVPPMPTTQVTFERDDRFAAPSTPENDQAWSSLMPDGDGFIVIPNNTRQGYHLPPGKSTRHGEVYDISLFHQLHCLANIRAHTYTLQAALGRDNWQEIYDILLKKGEDHVFHCFDYIRQALMCAGDLTVEWPRTEPDGRRFAVDGWGITHECKSWVGLLCVRHLFRLLTFISGGNHGLHE